MHLKLDFIEVHIDPVCPAVYRLKVQLEGPAVKIFSQTMNLLVTEVFVEQPLALLGSAK